MECLWCGKPLWGRSDKKFCDAGCRSTYHNARRKREGEEVKKVNRFLARNYNVLKSLDQRHVKCISIGKLTEMGFNPGYFTGSRIPSPRPGRKAGTVVYFCYDYSYTLNRTHLYLHSVRKEI